MRNFFIATISVYFFLAASIAEAATLTITPSSGTQQVGNVFTLSIMIDTAGAGVDGVDIHYLNYDPTVLEIQGTTITPGALFANTNANLVNTQTGKIDFSQISAGGTQFTGQGTLATIQFKPMKAGAANLTFDFALSVTTDTNVSSFGADVLTAVTNAQFTITEPPPPPDTTPPAISALAVSDVSQNSAIIRWNTNEPATYLFHYGTTASYGTMLPSTTLATAHSVTLITLAPGTLYHFKIVSSDQSGNQAQTADQTFSTQSPPPAIPPSGGNPSGGSPSGGSPSGGSPSGGSPSGGSPSGGSPSGGTPAQSPVISNIFAQNVNENSTKLTWNTDVATTGEVRYGLTKEVTNSTTVETAKTKHEVVLSNLIANTQYHFQIKSKTPSGGESSSDIKNFTTMRSSPPVNPAPPPLVPRLVNQRFSQATGLTFLQTAKGSMVTVRTITVLISFQKPDDRAVKKVNIWRSEKKCEHGTLVKTIELGETQSHQYTDAFTSPNVEEVFYVVSSLNDKGEESSRVWQWSSARNAVAHYITRFAKNDTDCDGIADARERLYGTNQNNPDTDADGFLDGVEVESGFHPKEKGAKKLHDARFAERFKGRILLAPQFDGESYYLEPDTAKAYYLGRPQDAFALMRAFGVGIRNTDLAKLPEAGKQTAGDLKLQKKLAGKILLQAEAKGEAWYVHPIDLKRYYMGRPAEAFKLMRALSLGISNENLIKLDLQL